MSGVYCGIKYGKCLLIIHLWPIYYLNRHFISYILNLLSSYHHSSISLKYYLNKFNQVYQYLIKMKTWHALNYFTVSLVGGCLPAGGIFIQLLIALYYLLKDDRLSFTVGNGISVLSGKIFVWVLSHYSNLFLHCMPFQWMSRLGLLRWEVGWFNLDLEVFLEKRPTILFLFLDIHEFIP